MYMKHRPTSGLLPDVSTAKSRGRVAQQRRSSDTALRYVVLLVLGMVIGHATSYFQHRSRGEVATVHVKLQQLQPTASKTMPQKLQHPATTVQQHRQPSSQDQQPLLLQDQQAFLQDLAANGQLYIATAANSAYFSGLTNLIGSIRYWCPECHVLAYNLGLSPSELDTIRSWCNVTVKWEDGVSGATHLKAAKKYAWKPLAILEAVKTYKRVLWLDAGSTVTTPLRTTVWPLLLQDGHFLVQGQDNNMVPWCHDLTWAYFKLDKNKFQGKPSYSGNTVGFVYDSPAYHKILKPWVECAAVEACMAPPGTSTANHRFDQSVLSIITYTSGLNVTEHTELLLAAQVPCFQAHARAVWTSRQGCSCYQKFAADCSASAELDQSYLPPYPK